MAINRGKDTVKMQKNATSLSTHDPEEEELYYPKLVLSIMRWNDIGLNTKTKIMSVKKHSLVGWIIMPE